MIVFLGEKGWSEEKGEDGDGCRTEERCQHGGLHHESVISSIAETEHGAVGGDRHADDDSIDGYDDGRYGDEERDSAEKEKDEERDEGEAYGSERPHARLRERLAEVDIGHGRADNEKRSGNRNGADERDGLGDEARDTRNAESNDGDGEVGRYHGRREEEMRVEVAQGELSSFDEGDAEDEYEERIGDIEERGVEDSLMAKDGSYDGIAEEAHIGEHYHETEQTALNVVASEETRDGDGEEEKDGVCGEAHDEERRDKRPVGESVAEY